MKQYVAGFISALVIAYILISTSVGVQAANTPTITVIRQNVDGYDVRFFKLIDGNVTCYSNVGTSCLYIGR